jgi:protoporphyrinogen oxidase
MGWDRRDVLKAGLGLMGASLSGWLSGCAHSPSTAQADDLPYDVPEWTGDSFAPMHRIRDGQLTAVPPPSEKTPLVIVGGGLSALTAAYQLRHEPFLLLEREATLGGNAKQGEYQGVPYALGSAYLVDTEAPYGPFYHDLGLTLTPVAEPVDSAYARGRFTDLATGPLAKEFDRMKRQLSALMDGPDFPVVPIAQASPTAMALDTLSFEQYLREQHYSEPFIQAVDAYCYSALGGSVRTVSAYAGVNFYSEIAGPIYAFPGGNAAVVAKLRQALVATGAERLRTGVSVYQIQQRPNGTVWVSYCENDSGRLKTVECEAVIFAAPYLLASRIFKDLPQDTAAPLRLSYGAYLVANLCFDQRVFAQGYDHWVPGNPSFTDFITADYASRPTPPTVGTVEPFVLTVYAPYREPWAGRSQLLRGNRVAIARNVVEAVQQVVAFPQSALKSVRLTRYGHQLLTSQVGIVTRLRSLPKQLGPYILAHSDGQGMASIESAITEGLAAAKAAKAFLAEGALWNHSPVS